MSSQHYRMEYPTRNLAGGLGQNAHTEPSANQNYNGGGFRQTQEVNRWRRLSRGGPSSATWQAPNGSLLIANPSRGPCTHPYPTAQQETAGKTMSPVEGFVVGDLQETCGYRSRPTSRHVPTHSAVSVSLKTLPAHVTSQTPKDNARASITHRTA